MKSNKVKIQITSWTSGKVLSLRKRALMTFSDFTNRGANDPLMIKHQPDSLDDILKDFGLEVSGGDFTKEQFLKAKAAIQALIDKRVIRELEDLSMDVVEPCEPECDAVRHALHQGSWNAHLIIENRIKALSDKHSSKEDVNE